MKSQFFKLLRPIFIGVMLCFFMPTHAQYSVYVGRYVTVYNPTPPQGTIHACAWSSNRDEVFCVQKEYGCNICVQAYFSGTATIECNYYYSFWSPSLECMVVSQARAYFYITALPITMTLNTYSLQLHPGGAEELTYSFSPEPEIFDTPYVEWSSTDDKVATVSKYGVVKGVASGTCYIVADGHTGNPVQRCKVTVEKVDPTEVSIDKEITMNIGETYKIAPKLKPSYAETEFTYSSSQPSVASVTEKTGVLTALSSGTSNITVRTSNGLFDSGVVKVRPEPTRITISPANTTLKIGQKQTLEYVLYPSGSGVKSLVWSSSDTNIVTVSQNGEVTAKAPGEAFIYVTASNGVQGECQVTIPFPRYNLIVWMKDDQKLIYSTSEKPRIVYGATTILISSTNSSIEYLGEEVVKLTMQESETDEPVLDLIETIMDEQPTQDMFYQSEKLTLSGFKAGTSVSIYNMSGQLVMMQKIGEDGCQTLSLATLNSGVYVVKCGNKSYKIHKK